METVSDFAAQAIINSIIHSHYPNDAIVGEEDSNGLQTNNKLCETVLNLVNNFGPKILSEEEMIAAIDYGKGTGGSGRFWTLDPIDGTKGFLRGGQYAVCLALIVDGIVVVGVLGTPNLLQNILIDNGQRGGIFYAVQGKGAYQTSLVEPFTSLQISCQDLNDIKEATFVESVESSHSSHFETNLIATQLGMYKPPTRMDSQCKYACIARGDASIYLRIPVNPQYQEKIWDHAAGALIVSESGGLVTDIHGNPLNFSQGRTLSLNKGIIACNKSIHSLVLQAVRSVLKY